MNTQKKIIVGLTGSIACVKGLSLCQALRYLNYQVRVAMTRSASQFVTPLTLASVSDCPPYIEMWEQSNGGEKHILWSEWADAIVIAPATASCLSDLSHGRYDSPVTLLAGNIPCNKWLIAPAMAEAMWNQPAVVENINRLKSWGALFLEPKAGPVASLKMGRRLMEPREIATAISSFFGDTSCA